jgi:CheY-like chemotaxis protein
MMLEDCWRLDRTICDILDLSRIESGRLKLNTACVPFRCMVERTAEALRMEVEGAALTLQIEPDAAPGFVVCDAAKIERVITNILGNAIKFTPAGGVISVGVLAQGRHGIDGICCRIIDSGAGIPAEYINRVTERFFRVGEQVGGTGLGLSIAKEITEHHQGSLEIASPPPGADTGTQVTLWLPTAPPPQVLIVAHDSGIRSVLVPALQRRGYCTVCYENGRHALQMLHDGTQNIVIVDSLIPDMDGLEIIMHIKADALLRTLPLFFLSEEAPSPAKSSILQNFDIPVFLKTSQTEDLVTAVDLALLPQHNGFHKIVQGRNPAVQ